MPFTQEQYLNLFYNYDNNVWPAQIILYFLAFLSLFLLIRKFSFSNRIISLILSFLWIWMGIVYHIIFFSIINTSADIIGAVFIFQGILFFYSGVIEKKINYNMSNSLTSLFGFVFIISALVIYPLTSIFISDFFYSTFGLPGPTIIFTFGFLLLAGDKLNGTFFIIPFLWSVISFNISFNLGIYEDIMLLITASVTSMLILYSLKHKYALSN